MRVRASRSLERESVAVDWTCGSSFFRAFLKVLRTGARRGEGIVPSGLRLDGEAGGSVWSASWDGEVEASNEGCVVRMSVMIWIEMICRAGWPRAKQWRKRVMFSDARFCEVQSIDMPPA